VHSSSPPDRAAARRVVASSALVGVLSSFAMNATVPALPEIQARFGATVAATQAIVSAGFLSLALGNLLIGPLSDRLGRKRVVLAGLALFVAGSIAATLAPSIGAVVAARIVQAFGIGAAAAVSRAALTDHFGPERASTAIAYTAMAILLAPLVAPSIGGFATEWAGWHMPFALSAALGAGAAWFIARRVQEAPRVPRADDGRHVAHGALRAYAALLRDPSFVAYALFGSFMLSSVYAFLSGAPYVVRQLMGLSASSYGLLAALPAVASLAGFTVAARITRRIGARRMLAGGVLLAIAGGSLLVMVTALHVSRPLPLFLAAMVFGFAHSLSIPSAMAGAIGLKPGLAGAASGLMGFMQLALASLWSQSIGWFANATPWPMAIAVLAANLLAGACFLRLRRLLAA
jgi:MFS transporter, DHA1 family, multidrug resistance protein